MRGRAVSLSTPPDAAAPELRQQETTVAPSPSPTGSMFPRANRVAAGPAFSGPHREAGTPHTSLFRAGACPCDRRPCQLLPFRLAAAAGSWPARGRGEQPVAVVVRRAPVDQLLIQRDGRCRRCWPVCRWTSCARGPVPRSFPTSAERRGGSAPRTASPGRRPSPPPPDSHRSSRKAGSCPPHSSDRYSLMACGSPRMDSRRLCTIDPGIPYP